MKEKLGKNTKIITLGLGIMITIIGVTYSFVAPLISGVETESTIAFGSGMIKITYNGSNIITGENIIPGWSDTKEFTVVGYNNTSVNDEDIMDYAIKLVVEENTFSDGAIRFELTGSSTNVNDTLSPLFGKVPTGTGETLVGTARFSQDEGIKSDVTHSYSLKIGFPNSKSKSQNEDMNKTFRAFIKVEEGTLQETSNEPMLLSEYIETTYNGSFNSTSTIEEDDFGNLRYVGATPNNYIIFNDETWRIIGIVDGGVKIIREDRITDIDGNNTFQWNNINENDWSTASLQTYLNGTYYNSLSAITQEQIQERTWYLGGWDSCDVSAKDIYTYEREKVNEGNSKEWQGKIALMYASDYGYANTIKTCRDSIFGCGYSFPSFNNWIKLSQEESENEYYHEWTISQHLSAFYKKTIFFVNKAGQVMTNNNFVTEFYSVRPCLYLKSNVYIVSGTGLSSDPYIIG